MDDGREREKGRKVGVFLSAPTHLATHLGTHLIG
jgi:hypothetical protein